VSAPAPTHYSKCKNLPTKKCKNVLKRFRYFQNTVKYTQNNQWFLQLYQFIITRTGFEIASKQSENSFIVVLTKKSIGFKSYLQI
jgi:hypothetical protein